VVVFPYTKKSIFAFKSTVNNYSASMEFFYGRFNSGEYYLGKLVVNIVIFMLL